ncbi:MAG: DUF3592 domain-containing protein [Bacteroidia bacterium]|nr:DUF3592 domain-containing protein [Bacteroidia bacterium]
MKNNSTFNSLSGFDIPRTISGGLKARILLGQPLTFMALIFLLFGGIFPIIFSTQMDFKRSFAFGENDPLAKGIIKDKIKTSTRVNKRNVYEYVFEFKLQDGKTYKGNSYAHSFSGNSGDSVMIQYVQKDPSLSIIQGTNSSAMPFFVLPLTCIFPLLGLIFVFIGIKKGRKHIYLVTHGILTKGKVTHKEPTNTKINKKTVYKVFFEYKSQEGTLQKTFLRTHVTYNLGDEEQEPLVYDPEKPSQGVLLDALPKQVRKFFEGT